MFQYTTFKWLYLFLILLSDLNQAQWLLSNIKQLIKKQNDEISQLHKKVVKLQIVNEMLVDANVEILCKNEMIEKAFRLRGIK